VPLVKLGVRSRVYGGRAPASVLIPAAVLVAERGELLSIAGARSRARARSVPGTCPPRAARATGHRHRPGTSAGLA